MAPMMETTRGWRYMDRSFSSEPMVGDVLPASRVWDGDEPTETELPGTCAWATRKAAESYAKYSRGGGWLVELEADAYSCGQDHADEIVMRNARVVAVEAW